jgi:hypothetical protein
MPETSSFEILACRKMFFHHFIELSFEGEYHHHRPCIDCAELTSSAMHQQLRCRNNLKMRICKKKIFVHLGAALVQSIITM